MRKLISICAFALVLVALAPAAMADPARGTATQCYVWANNASPAINTPYTPATSIPTTRSAGARGSPSPGPRSAPTR